MIDIQQTRQEIFNAVCNEYRPIIIAGNQYSPIEAAKIISDGINQNDWIPFPVTPGEPLPLNEEELIELYNSNSLLTENDLIFLSYNIPGSEAIPSLEKIAFIIKNIVSIQESSSYLDGEEYWRQSNASLVSIKSLVNTITDTYHILHDTDEWKLPVIKAGITESSEKRIWEVITTHIETIINMKKEYELDFIDKDPQIDEELIDEKTIEVLNDIITSLKDHKMTTPVKFRISSTWKEIKKNSLIQGKEPKTIDDFVCLKNWIRLCLERRTLTRRWNALFNDASNLLMDPSISTPEDFVNLYVPTVRECLTWYKDKWCRLLVLLKDHGFQWAEFVRNFPLTTEPDEPIKQIRDMEEPLLQYIHAMDLRKQLSIYKDEIQSMRLSLMKYSCTSIIGHPIEKMAKALHNFDLENYTLHYKELQALVEKRSILNKRNTILEKLESHAPAWAKAIEIKNGVHGLDKTPGDPKKAWLWRQLNDEIERRIQTDLPSLHSRLEKLNEDFRHVTCDYIEKMTWAHQIRKTTKSQRQALVGWKDIVQKIGKGKGKRAPLLHRQARENLLNCQSAVPVWIMPIDRIIQSFDPQKHKFDVVIIDEASQSDALALSILYFGKSIVVVGDDKQVSPDKVGLKIDDVQAITEEYLHGIPNPTHYDGISSIYDIAKASFDPVCLKEHFRCVAPIIQFCNHLSYGDIKPLRDDSQVLRKPATIAYRVDAGYQDHCVERKTNSSEAETIVALIRACMEQSEYKDATFGIIPMVGDEQGLKIDKMLRAELPEVEYINRKILCGGPSSFQGDERDIIFISMITKPNSGGPLPLNDGEGSNGRDKKRYNVAVSRARDQLWVVHSLDENIDLKPNDIRLRLIEHAKNPQAIQELIEFDKKRAESPFEIEVIEFLRNQGYDLVPQWQVGAYRIDIVVVSGENKIAIECDGEKYHTDENIEYDIRRQTILERMGWRFIRIRGSEYYRDKSIVMNRLLMQLGEYNIVPCYKQTDEPGQLYGDLVDRIVRRAHELLKKSKSMNSIGEYSVQFKYASYNTEIKDESNAISSSDNVNSNNTSDNELTEYTPTEVAAETNINKDKGPQIVAAKQIHDLYIRRELDKLENDLREYISYIDRLNKKPLNKVESVKMDTYIANIYDMKRAMNSGYNSVKGIIDKSSGVNNHRKSLYDIKAELEKYDDIAKKIEEQLKKINDPQSAQQDQLTIPMTTDVMPNTSAISVDSSSADDALFTENPDFWFAAAKWGKMNNQLKPYERKFVYQIGQIYAQGRTPTDKQQTWARDIHQRLIDAGFEAPEKDSEQLSILPQD